MRALANLLVSIGLCSVSGTLAVAATPSGDGAVKRGEDDARLICSACHVVAKDQQFSPLLQPPAPSFEEIANRPNTTVDSVRHFVTHTHWDEKTLPMRMPDLMLTAEQATELARYLVSLRKPKSEKPVK
jgi:mono/diheme cytochrome c family protein